MHPRTAATLDELARRVWFTRAGLHDTENADVLSSWRDAERSCASPEWRDLLLEAANQYRARLNERDRQQFATWNQRVVEIKPRTEALVEDRTRAVVAANSLGQAFVNAVRWDILHLAMEAEFADVYPPGFFASQAYWYASGHFPCGWRGKFPQGKLVIY